MISAGSTSSRSASAARTARRRAPWRCRCRRPSASSVGSRHTGSPSARQWHTAPSAAAVRPDTTCLAVMQRRPGDHSGAQPAHQPAGEMPLGRAERVGVPFRFVACRSADDEGRLAAHRQPHIAGRERAIDARRRAARMSCHCVVGVRLGDARRLARRVDRHLEAERRFRMSRRAPVIGGGGCGSGVRGERDVALAGQQAGGGVQADPAGARQIDFGPGVQVGEVGGRACRAVERLHVGDELDQIAGDEARGEAEMAQQPAPAARRNRGRSPGRPPAFPRGV